MKTAIIVHGTPSKESYLSREQLSESNRHWIPWLQNQLLIEGYHHCWTPDMPLPYAPDYSLWKEEFERYTLTPQSLVVGHSCGGGFLIRWLSENPIELSRLILVAPWLDPDKRKCPDFFNFKIDLAITERMQVHLFSSDNDDDDIHVSEKRIQEALPNLHYRQFSNYGHFCYSDMQTEIFPELLEELLR